MSVFHNLYETKLNDALKEVKTNKYATMSTIFNSYYTTVVSTFSWKNLPKKVLLFLPEEYLCYWGMIAFFKDDKNEYNILPCWGSGKLLENGEYSEYSMVAKNGKTYTRKREDIALCYDNCMKIPSIIMIRELSSKSSKALRAVDASLRKATMPAILSAKDEIDMATISDMYDEEKEDLPFRVTNSNSLKNDNITKYSIYDNREIDILAQWDVYVRYRNLFYTMNGVNNVEVQKKERLTEAEGSGNDEITRYTLLKDKYRLRLGWVKEIKEKFSYDMEFELNRDSTTVYELSLSNKEKIDNIEIDLLKGVNYAENNINEESDNND